jgi:hypothetical protein
MTRIGKALGTVALGAVMLGMPMLATAELYRYDDENGKRHVANDLNDVPVQFREAAIADLKARGNGDTLNIIEGDDSKAPSKATPSAPSSLSDPALIGGYDRYWWKSQMQEKQGRVDELQKQLEIKKDGRQEFSDEITGNAGPDAPKVDDSDGRSFGRAGLRDDDMTVGKLEELLAEAEKDLDEFKERARQTSVPPGWLR